MTWSWDMALEFKEDWTKYWDNGFKISPENKLDRDFDNFKRECIDLFADYQLAQLKLFKKYK